MITNELLIYLIPLIITRSCCVGIEGSVKISIKLCFISKVSLPSWLFLDLDYFCVFVVLNFIYVLYILRNMI